MSIAPMGGSWRRDPTTGQLTRLTPDPAAQAAAIAPAAEMKLPIVSGSPAEIEPPAPAGGSTKGKK